MTSVTINGHTYTDDSDPTTGMGNGGHRTRFIPALNDVVVVAAEVESDRASAATSASSASSSASSASTSATNAASSASNASTSASTATTQASNASTSATNAASSATAAAGSATSASTSATNAASSATTASTAATTATTQAGNASTSATAAASSATSASTSATNASNSAAAAATSETNAAASAALFVAGQLRTVSATLTATGTTQTDALALTNEENICTTVAAGTGVKLMAKPATGGKIVYVFNRGANPLKVYPASGESFNALATNAAITLAVGGILEARSDETTRWNVCTNQITNLVADGNLAMGGKAISGHSMLSHDAPIVLGSTSGTINIDWSLSSYYILPEPTGAVTLTFTDPPANTKLQLLIRSDGTSTAYGFTFPGTVKQFGTAWTTTTANKMALLNFEFTDSVYLMMGSSEA